MAGSGREKPSLYETLLRQGVTREQIERVARDLRDRGYGEAETARKQRPAPQQPRVPGEPARVPGEQPRLTEPPRERRAEPARQPASAPADAGLDGQPARRAIDWLPEVPPWLRRRINRYAYRNGFLITRFAERVDDFWSLFDAAREDCASRVLLRLLAEHRGYRERTPWLLSFVDTLDALRDSALRLMGIAAADSDRAGPGSGDEEREEAVRVLRARDPFALEFFSQFTEPNEMLRRSLEYLEARAAAGERVRIAELARVVREGCRLIVVTEAVEHERLERVFDAVREVDAARHPREQGAREMADAESLFRAAHQNLRRFGHELYPALLKMIASFYPEEDASLEKRERILAFLGLREDQILTWSGWQRTMREQREQALREEKARELERLEQEKRERLSVRFEGILSTLAALFPDSGIERIEQGEHILPYFANRVFRRTSLFQARLAELELLSSTDIMGLLVVLHAILDDLLSSVEPYALEKILGRETLAGEIITLRDMWEEVYSRLFEPYLEEIREFAREIEGDPQFVKLFRESQRARGIEERINRLRNRAIRNFGHVISERDHGDGPRLYELAARLADMAEDIGGVLNRELLGADDPVRRRIAADLARGRLVDFVARSQTSSPDYRPVTRQVRRWVEARHRESVLDIPQKAQIAFIDVLRGVAELYDYLLNDSNSFAARTAPAVVVASGADRERWARERGERGRSAAATLRATLREEFPGQYTDTLTGLKNKDYFLNELPKELAKLRALRRPLSFLMIDIDHFKWLNDELGHPRGDDVLKAAGGMLLDNIRDGDLAIRYGGEEMLVVVPSDLHTGIILAERLRYAQEAEVSAREAMEDVRGVGTSRGEPCGTFSIGVADVTSLDDLAQAVLAADRALYHAKRTRNAVVFVDPSRRADAEPFTTYAEYDQRTRGATA